MVLRWSVCELSEHEFHINLNLLANKKPVSFTIFSRVTHGKTDVDSLLLYLVSNNKKTIFSFVMALIGSFAISMETIITQNVIYSSLL